MAEGKALLKRAWDPPKYMHDVPRVAYFLEISSANIVLLILAVAYMSGNIVLLTLHTVDTFKLNTAENGTVLDTIKEQNFHNIEFLGTFFFTILNQFILVYSPENSFSNYVMKWLKCIALVNILSSCLSAVLVVVDLEKFEVPSHELEYANAFLMAAFDVIILLGRKPKESHEADYSAFWASMEKWEGYILSFMSILVAVLQPIVYNSLGWSAETSNGQAISCPWPWVMNGTIMCTEPNGEMKAHYIEFSFEILSAFVSARIIYNNKMAADQELRCYPLSCALYDHHGATTRLGFSLLGNDAFALPKKNDEPELSTVYEP